MRIADILDSKGRAVHTVLPWVTVAEAIGRLNRLHIGALLVCDENRSIKGIVSERDILRELDRHGSGVLTMQVSEIMTRHVETCQSDDSVSRAMARMTTGRYRHLPVVEGRALVGIVSIGDLVKHRVREMELETGVLRDAVIARS